MSQLSHSLVDLRSSDLQYIAQSSADGDGDIFYRSLRFTRDGTCVIAQRDDHSLDTFVLPPDLLDIEPLSRNVQVYSRGSSPSSLLCFAVHPSFALSDTNTTWALSSSVDLPISLRNALSYDHTSISYPWVSPTTEQFHSANSLAFVSQGTHFSAGSHGRLALFDLSRPNEAPVSVHNCKRKGSGYTEGLQDRGIVMALAESPSGLLAAGTSTRSVALFTASGQGTSEVHFSLANPASTTDTCKGTGITSLAWSSCERYLIVAERQSDEMQVYDIRHGGTRLARLSGRNALSTQRFDVDIVRSVNGDEIWSGSIDGQIRMWHRPGAQTGEQKPDLSIPVATQPVGSVSWHPSGTVLATCVGGRLPGMLSESSNDSNDSIGRKGVSIWTMLHPDGVHDRLNAAEVRS